MSRELKGLIFGVGFIFLCLLGMVMMSFKEEGGRKSPFLFHSLGETVQPRPQQPTTQPVTVKVMTEAEYKVNYWVEKTRNSHGGDLAFLIDNHVPLEVKEDPSFWNKAGEINPETKQYAPNLKKLEKKFKTKSGGAAKQYAPIMLANP